MISIKRVLVFSFVLTTIILAATSFASAQMRLPRPSQAASVTQTIGVTDVTISYSRPAVKGRTIFADAPATMAARAKGEGTLDDQNQRLKGEPIVPYAHIWRTGANDATQFTVTSDVTVNGQKLAAGTYSLHTIPGKTEWTIVFNGAANQWGSFNYDPSKDTLRVKATPIMVKENQELMAFMFDPVTDNSATVNICWEKVRVPFTVSVDVVPVTLEKARASLATAKPDDWRTRLNAGTYAMENKDTADGMLWLGQALTTLDSSIAAKETFMNLNGKFNTLLAMGRKDEALAAADKAIAKAKADKMDITSFEKRVADIRAGKQ